MSADCTFLLPSCNYSDTGMPLTTLQTWMQGVQDKLKRCILGLSKLLIDGQVYWMCAETMIA